MRRYIDAYKIPRHGKRGGECYWQEIEQLPTADVRENVKGKWIIKTDGFVIKRVWGVCSECGNTLDFSGVNAGRGDANFCPNCGADMRGDQT